MFQAESKGRIRVKATRDEAQIWISAKLIPDKRKREKRVQVEDDADIRLIGLLVIGNVFSQGGTINYRLQHGDL